MVRSLFFLAVLLTGSILCAQTAAELDQLLETREVSFAQASRFVLAVAEVKDGALEAGPAYTLAEYRGWLPKGVPPDSPIKLGDLCYLMMCAFDLQGSFLYTLLPGPHYAYREFDYLKLIPGRRDPGLKVSGERFLLILETVSSYREANR
jgi:hypothetical protein